MFRWTLIHGNKFRLHSLLGIRMLLESNQGIWKYPQKLWFRSLIHHPPFEDPLLQTLAFSAWNLNRAVEICDGDHLLLVPRYADECDEVLQQHLRSFQFLAVRHGVNARLFNMRPKCHYNYHTGDQTRKWQINPFCFDCFDEESWLGHIKRIAKQCHGSTMTARVLSRYLICLGLFLENHRRQVENWRPAMARGSDLPITMLKGVKIPTWNISIPNEMALSKDMFFCFYTWMQKKVEIHVGVKAWNPKFKRVASSKKLQTPARTRSQCPALMRQKAQRSPRHWWLKAPNT